MRKTATTILGAFVLAGVLMPAMSSARDDQAQQRDDQPSVKHGVQGSHDGGMAKTPTTAKEFVEKAAQDGLAEVELGKLATKKGMHPDVKQFAQRMVDDHTKANTELKSLASAKNIKTPTDPGAAHKATMDKLSKMSGADFDRAYMQAMVGDHDHAVTTFRGFSEHGDDPELKQWATKTLPTLEEHERLAKTTAAKLTSTTVGERTSKTTTEQTGR
jgi:putative membrane protein